MKKFFYAIREVLDSEFILQFIAICAVSIILGLTVLNFFMNILKN